MAQAGAKGGKTGGRLGGKFTQGTGGKTANAILPPALPSKSGNMGGKAKNMRAKQVRGTPKGSITRGK
jgi:hypothetical protein